MNLKDAIAVGAAVSAGAALVPGAKQVLDDAINEMQYQAQEAVYRSFLEELSPKSRQIVALQEAGVMSLFGRAAFGVEILPIRKRPLKPKPRGREALVKRQKKARL